MIRPVHAGLDYEEVSTGDVRRRACLILQQSQRPVVACLKQVQIAVAIKIKRDQGATLVAVIELDVGRNIIKAQLRPATIPIKPGSIRRMWR